MKSMNSASGILTKSRRTSPTAPSPPTSCRSSPQYFFLISDHDRKHKYAAPEHSRRVHHPGLHNLHSAPHHTPTPQGLRIMQRLSPRRQLPPHVHREKTGCMPPYIRELQLRLSLTRRHGKPFTAINRADNDCAAAIQAYALSRHTRQT